MSKIGKDVLDKGSRISTPKPKVSTIFGMKPGMIWVNGDGAAFQFLGTSGVGAVKIVYIGGGFRYDKTYTAGKKVIQDIDWFRHQIKEDPDVETYTIKGYLKEVAEEGDEKYIIGISKKEAKKIMLMQRR